MSVVYRTLFYCSFCAVRGHPTLQCPFIPGREIMGPPVGTVSPIEDPVWEEMMNARHQATGVGGRTIVLANTEEAMDEFLRSHGIRVFKKMDKRGIIQRLVSEQGNRVMYQNTYEAKHTK